MPEYLYRLTDCFGRECARFRSTPEHLHLDVLFVPRVYGLSPDTRDALASALSAVRGRGSVDMQGWTLEVVAGA